MISCAGTPAREWSTAFQRKSVKLRLPISGVFELTSRCNLDCRHCYLGPAAQREKKRHQELSTEDVFKILDEITEAGCLYLVLTGGDPMLRPDFAAIYRHARENGLILTVFCNGNLVDDRVIELFREYPPFRVDVSVYGASAGTYEKITRVPGSFSRFIEGVKRLAEGGIGFSMKTVLMTLNQHELPAMRKLARDLGAVHFRMDSAILPCFPGGSREPMNLRVDPEVAVSLEMSDPETLAGWIEYCGRMEGLPTDGRLYNCGAGVTDFYIDPYGNASPCLMTTQYRFPITESRNFRQLWENELQQIQSLRVGAGNLCASCEMKAACTGCPAFNLHEKGSENMASEYLCETTRLRWESIRLGKQLPVLAQQQQINAESGYQHV